MNTRDSRRVIRRVRHHRLRAHDLRHHAAAINIARTESTGTPAAARAKPMLAMSSCAQVDLRRAARTLRPDHQIVLRLQAAGNCRERTPSAAGFNAGIVARLNGGDPPDPAPRPDEPTSDSGFSRTQGSCRCARASPQANACNACARPISPPSAGHGGVVGHVLGLEGGDGQATTQLAPPGTGRPPARTCRHSTRCPET